MTRQMSSVMPYGSVVIIAAIIALLGLSAITQVQASEHQWTSLDGPYWANGIDLAYGMSGLGQEWHRYLIGSDGDETKPFYWRESNQRWMLSNSPPLAYNKIISYKNAGSGHYAFCSVVDDDIYRTSDGGVNWDHRSFPSNFNRHFATIEILNWQTPGHTIFVGTESDGSSATAYYTTDRGRSWYRLGGESVAYPMYCVTVNDIESLASGELTAGTFDGIFEHDADYDSPWKRSAFKGDNVTAIDNIELGMTQQVAAVTGPDGQTRLYYTSDAWDKDIREIGLDVKLPPDHIHDLSAIYWGESHISCYLASDNGAYSLTFDDDDPSAGKFIDLGKVDVNLRNRRMNAVDYIVDYENGSAAAAIIMTGPDAVYEIREYRQHPQIIDSLRVSTISSGLPAMGE